MRAFRIISVVLGVFSAPLAEAQEVLTENPAATAPKVDMTSSISFANSPVSDVLNYYSRLTGKKIIRDNNVSNLSVTIFASEPMTKEEATHFIESALLLNGVALVPVSDTIVEALSTANRKPGSEVVPMIYGVDGLPPTNEVVTYFMPLKYLSPDDAKKIFETHLPLHDYGNITAAPGISALLITENARLINRFVQLQALIDKRPITLERRFVQLQRADAERVADLVREAMGDKKSGASGPAVVTNAPSGGGAASAEPRIISEDIRLIPDIRTNRILVVAPADSLPLVCSLIDQFDSPIALKPPFTRTLYYISAVDTLPALVDILSDKGDKSSGGEASGIPQSIPRAEAVNPGQTSSDSGGGGSTTRADQLSSPEGVRAPVSMTIGKTILMANPDSNTILVSGTPESVDKINAVLDRLDTRPKQVYLATIIGQLTLGNSTEFGINYLLNFSQSSKGTGVAGTFIPGSIFGNGGSGTPGSTGGPINPVTLINPAAFSNLLSGLTLYGVIADQLTYYVSALESTGRFKVLSRPVVYTTNNKKAKISSGQKIPVPTSSLTSLTTTPTSPSVSSSIDYKDVLLKLEVVPLINGNGEVTLQIFQTNDSIQGNQNVSGNSIPIIGTQELNTTITVKNGQTIVLGGLVSESIHRDRSGLPLLMNIPYMGYLFSNSKVQKDRQELIIFIQPIIVDDDKTALAVTQKEEQRTSLVPDVESVKDFEKKGKFIEVRKAIPVEKRSASPAKAQ